MPKEIERKFLVSADAWRSAVKASTQIVQGYVARGRDIVVRVRVTHGARDAAQARLTIKSKAAGLVRDEFEYEIPPDDARQLLGTCEALIEKTRHDVESGGVLWSVDEFHGVLAGFVLAEIELNSENQTIDPPPWAGREVTHDPDYRNEQLAERTSPPQA